ncbi:MAG: TetR/AcrR family transcriptional regulator [Polyangiales bacterium]
MSPKAAPSPVKRRVGRPRKRLDAAPDGEPREQILTAAAALFAARGIAEVSMLEIAHESGLGQSSLYYWYRRKEQIVAELLQQVNRLPLAFARQLKDEGDGADVQLYRLVRFDVRTVCDFPLEITEVHRFSRRDKPAFETYWRERRELTAALEGLVRRGIADGLFREVDPGLCALTIIAQDESVQNWYLREPPSRREPRGHRADEIADFVASQTVGGLMVAPSRLSQLLRRAARSDPRPRGA